MRVNDLILLESNLKSGVAKIWDRKSGNYMRVSYKLRKNITKYMQ